MNNDSFYLLIVGIIGLCFGMVMGVYEFWFWESGFYWIMNLMMFVCLLTGFKIGRTSKQGSKE